MWPWAAEARSHLGSGGCPSAATLDAGLADAGWAKESEHVDGTRYDAPMDAHLFVDAQPAATPVPNPPPPVCARPTCGRGPYLVLRQGPDWQSAWSGQRARHPYVVIVRGSVVFEHQPW